VGERLQNVAQEKQLRAWPIPQQPDAILDRDHGLFNIQLRSRNLLHEVNTNRSHGNDQ
jgi:hypothetical protein